jgi:hypothetical protein
MTSVPTKTQSTYGFQHPLIRLQRPIEGVNASHVSLGRASALQEHLVEGGGVTRGHTKGRHGMIWKCCAVVYDT